MTSIRNFSLQPQPRRFMIRLIRRSGCCLRIERVKRYSQVMFAPSARSRIRESSSRNVTSRVQWHAFSTDQWPRTARQAAQVVADLDPLLVALHSPRRHHADRLQVLPLLLPRQALGGRQVQVGPLLLAAVPAIGRRQLLGPLEVPLQPLVDVLDDRPMQ